MTDEEDLEEFYSLVSNRKDDESTTTSLIEECGRCRSPRTVTTVIFKEPVKCSQNGQSGNGRRCRKHVIKECSKCEKGSYTLHFPPHS